MSDAVDATKSFLTAVGGASITENKEGVPKAVIKSILASYGEGATLMSKALVIADLALMNKTTWTGGSYAEHYLRVSGVGLPFQFISDDEKIVGILHDVVEDSDWTIEDLEEVGFSPAICEAVDSVTKRKGELYLDATKRASINPIGRRVKPRDNKDNMDLTRSTNAASDKQKYLYHISYTYLNAVEEHCNDSSKGIPPNYSIWKFLCQPQYKNLLTTDNVQIVAKSTSEPMPDAIARRFGLPTDGGLGAKPA